MSGFNHQINTQQIKNENVPGVGECEKKKKKKNENNLFHLLQFKLFFGRTFPLDYLSTVRGKCLGISPSGKAYWSIFHAIGQTNGISKDTSSFTSNTLMYVTELHSA